MDHHYIFELDWYHRGFSWHIIRSKLIHLNIWNK